MYNNMNRDQYFSEKFWEGVRRNPPQWRKRQSAAKSAYSREPTLENFGRAPRTRRTLNNYSRDWFGINLHGKPLNRRLALFVHPNKHGGNARAVELMKLLSHLLENSK